METSVYIESAMFFSFLRKTMESFAICQIVYVIDKCIDYLS